MKYLKTLTVLLIGLMLGSIVHFYAFADKVSVELREAAYVQADELVVKHKVSLGNRYAELMQELAAVKEKHKPLIEDEEALLAQAETLKCNKESDLAGAKLSAFANKDISLTPDDVKRLSEKVLWTCGEDSPNASLEAEAEMPPASAVDTAVFIPDPPKKELCTKNDVGEDQQQYVRMAAEISNNDLDFLTTLNQENGLWDPGRKAYGNEDSWGFCMFNRIWHSKTVDDPRFFTDPEWQMQKCWNAYKGGVRFYGYDVRKNSYNKFTCPSN